MKRNCYFEFAGIDSRDFGNLILAFVQNDSSVYDTGGSFELVTDELPQRSDKLLYGKKYSSSPMEFEIEIIRPDNFIPSERMAVLKEWLFGQDGWAKLKLYDMDDFNESCYFYCILKPNQDIFDCGYRGVRCTLMSRSPFAYQEERVIYDRDYSELLESCREEGTSNVLLGSPTEGEYSVYKTDKKYVYHVTNPTDTDNIPNELRAGISRYFDLHVESADKIIYPKVEVVTPSIYEGNCYLYHHPSIYNNSIHHGMILVDYANTGFDRQSLWIDASISNKYGEGITLSEASKRVSSITQRKFIVDCETGAYNIYKKRGKSWVEYEKPLNLRVHPSIRNTFSFLRLTNGVNKMGVQGWIKSLKISYTPRVRLGAF